MLTLSSLPPFFHPYISVNESAASGVNGNPIALVLSEIQSKAWIIYQEWVGGLGVVCKMMIINHGEMQEFLYKLYHYCHLIFFALMQLY